MPLKPKNGKSGTSRWLEQKKRGQWKPLADRLQDKLLHDARKLLRKAVDSPDLSDAEEAARALLGLPERYRAEALEDMNGLLEASGSGEIQELVQSRALAYVLVDLKNDGWAMLDGWERTQPLLEKHSKLLSDSLFMGNLNGVDFLALDALAYVTGCNAIDYDAGTLRYILQRYMKRHDAFMGYFALTNYLMQNGPEDLREVADEMEDRRIGYCFECLAYGGDRQFEASAELILLVRMGRTYLAPRLEAVRDEMLDLMDDPGVYMEDAESDEEAKQEQDQRQAAVWSKAAAILKRLEAIGMPIMHTVACDDAEGLETAKKMFQRLAERGVGLHLMITGESPVDALKHLDGIPGQLLHTESELRAQEALGLLQIAIMPPGNTEAQALEARAEALDGLKELHAAGVPLSFTLSCPAETDAQSQAEEIAQILEMFHSNGLAVKIDLAGENAEEVTRLLNNDAVAVSQESVRQEAFNALMNAAMFPQGANQEEAEANRAEAIGRLKEMQDSGHGLSPVMFPCPQEINPDALALSLSSSLDILRANGVDIMFGLVGENASAVAQRMGLEPAE